MMKGTIMTKEYNLTDEWWLDELNDLFKDIPLEPGQLLTIKDHPDIIKRAIETGDRSGLSDNDIKIIKLLESK